MGKIYLTGADNVRDLGGIKTRDGSVIKDGYLIRSNRLSKITKKDEELLREEYHLQKIIDLRTPMEVEEAPDKEVAGADWVHIPIFVEAMVGISHEKGNRKRPGSLDEFPRMEELYAMIAENPFCRQQMGKALRQIMETEQGAVLWHCTEGKDRCGLISAMTLFLLGVSEQDVMEDYLKTNTSAAKRIDGMYERWKSLGFSKGRMERLLGLFVAKEEYMQAALDRAKEACGTIDDYIREAIGIRDEEKEAFRMKVLRS